MSQTLKFGNGTWATKKGSTLAYNDEDGNFKPLPFTYTGAGKGTRVNKEGLIEVVENDRPRIDYTDSEDGVFLLEKAATNLVAYSEDIGNSAWGTNGGGVIKTLDVSKIAPNGISGVYKIENNASSSNSPFCEDIVSLSNSSTYTFSVYLYNDGNISNNNSYIYIYDSNNGQRKVFIDASKTNEWYRLSITAEIGASSSIETVGIQLNSEDGDNIYFWGAQLESGNLSSYIPTQGTIQTRVQETASGSGNSEVFNSEQGVLFANISGLTNNDDIRIISISDGTNDNRIYIGLDDEPNKLYFYMTIGGTFVMGFVDVVLNQTEYNKIALTYKSGQSSIYLNGFLVNLDDTTFSNGNLNRLDFKNRGTGNPFYGKTKEIGYYDEVLTDEELEYMTSYRTWEEMVKELNLNIIHNE